MGQGCVSASAVSLQTDTTHALAGVSCSGIGLMWRVISAFNSICHLPPVIDCGFSEDKYLRRQREWPLTIQMQGLMPSSVLHICADLHVALMAVLSLVLLWADTTLPAAYCYGHKIIGNIPPFGIFGDSKDDWVDESRILSESWEKVCEMVSSIRPGQDDAFILEQTQHHVSKGFADPVVSWRHFKSVHQPGTFRLIKRFVVP